jgi:hypothetical protein
MLVLCMWFDKRCWRGIPWCITVHVWLIQTRLPPFKCV